MTKTDVPVYLRLDPGKCIVRSYSVAGGSGKRPRLKLELEVDPEELTWMLRDLERAQEKPRSKAPSRKAKAGEPLLQIPHFKTGEAE